MDVDEFLIYGDLDDLHVKEQQKSKELLDAENKRNDALKEAEALRAEIKALEKKIKTITVNFQNLLDTAKAEIRRKDAQIQQLRREKDDICFRRRKPQAAGELFADNGPPHQHAAVHANANTFKFHNYAAVPTGSASPVEKSLSTAAVVETPIRVDEKSYEHSGRRLGNNFAGKGTKLSPQKSMQRSDRYKESTSSRRDSKDLNASEHRFGNSRDRRELDRNACADERRSNARSSKDRNNSYETVHKRHGHRESERGGTKWAAAKEDKKDLHRSDTKYGYEKQRSVDKNYFGHEKSRFRERSKSNGKQKDVDYEKPIKTSQSDKDTSFRNNTYVSTVKDDHKHSQVKEIERKPLMSTTTYNNDPGKHDYPISLHKTERKFTKSVEKDERTPILALQTDKQESGLTSTPADTIKSYSNSNEKINTPSINVADENSNFATVYQMNTPKKVALFDSLFGPSSNSNGSSANSLLAANVARLLNSGGSTTTSIGDYTDTSAKTTPSSKHIIADPASTLNANVEIVTDYFTPLQNDTPKDNSAPPGKRYENNAISTFSKNSEANTDDVLPVSLKKDENQASTSIADMEAIKDTFVGVSSENHAIEENQKATSTEALLKAPADSVLSSEKADPIIDHNAFSPNTAVLEASACPPQGFSNEPVSTELNRAIKKSTDDNGTKGQLKAKTFKCLDFSIDKLILDTGGENIPSLHEKHNDLLTDQTMTSAAQGDNESDEKTTQKNILKSQIEILENIHLPNIFAESPLAKNTNNIPKINSKTNEQNAEGNENLLIASKVVEIDVQNFTEQANLKPIKKRIRENAPVEVKMVDNAEKLINIELEQVQQRVEKENNLIDESDQNESKNELQAQPTGRITEKANVFEENGKHATYTENPEHPEKPAQHQLAGIEPPCIKEYLKQGEKLEEIVKICQHSSLDDVTNENDLHASDELIEANKKRISCKVVNKSEIKSTKFVDKVQDNSARESTNDVPESIEKSSSDILQKAPKPLSNDKDDNELVDISNAQCHTLKDSWKQRSSSISPFANDKKIDFAGGQLRELESSSEQRRRSLSAEKNAKESKAVEDGVSFITNNIMLATKSQKDSTTSKSTVKSKSFFKFKITNVALKSRKLSESKRPKTESKSAHSPDACKKTSHEDAKKSATTVDKEKETCKKIDVLEERSEKKQIMQRNPRDPRKETVGTNHIEQIRFQEFCKNTVTKNDASGLDTCRNKTNTQNGKTINLGTDCKSATAKIRVINYEKIYEIGQKLCEEKTIEARKNESNITIKTMEQKAFLKGTIQQSKVAIGNNQSRANNATLEKSINRHRRIVDSSSDDDNKPSTSKSAIASMKSRGFWIASPFDEKKELPTKSNLESKFPKSNRSDGEPSKTCTTIDNERPIIQNEIRTSSTKYHNLYSIAPKSSGGNLQSSKFPKSNRSDGEPSKTCTTIDNEQPIIQNEIRTSSTKYHNLYSIAPKSSGGNLQSLHSSTSHNGEEAKTLSIVQTMIQNDSQKVNKECVPVAKTTLNSVNSVLDVAVASAAKNNTKYNDDHPQKPTKIDELNVVATKPICVPKRKLDVGEVDTNIDKVTVDPHKKAKVDNQRNDSPVVDEGSDIFGAKTVYTGPLPVTPPAKVNRDAALTELDLRMQLIFQSPSQADASHQSTLEEQTSPGKKLKAANITINETVNETMSLPLPDPSPILNTPTNSNIKRMSLGSSDYVIEKVSDNVIKMFITRNRGKKKEKLNLTSAETTSPGNVAAATLI